LKSHETAKEKAWNCLEKLGKSLEFAWNLFGNVWKGWESLGGVREPPNDGRPAPWPDGPSAAST
jgi:hypothetical protein